MTAVKNQAARGPQKQTQDFRAQRGVQEYGGMVPDGNPASLSPWRPRLLINTRRRNGGFTNRRGQAKLNDNALVASGKIKGLVDFQIGTPKSLLAVIDGCPGISSSLGFTLASYDNEQSPKFQPGVYYNTGSIGLVVGVFGDDLYLGQDNTLRKLQAITPPYGQTALAQSGVSQDIPLLTPSGMTSITALQEFDGKLFVGCDGGTGSSKVISWDGITERDDFTSISSPTGFGLYRENLILGYDGSPNEIRVRAVGDSPGTWTQYTPGAGTAVFKSGVSYKDVFYFTTLGEDIFSFNGTTLTRIPVATTGIAAGSVTHGIAVFNNLLYVAYTTSTNRGRIAKFNGSAWTAIEKDIFAQFSDNIALRAMAAYRGNLVVGGLVTGSVGRFYFSPGTTTTGTWTEVAVSASFGGDINQLVVF